ncbi:TetR family transcriptional regulator [Streptomyces sp. MAR4 CNX-425]|uniref:TetR family transcriptional regulator n=1 Tax=Streptomyces sp. MAR4 CNX-425 TaxID=3406343 RepID=UPI003B50C070
MRLRPLPRVSRPGQRARLPARAGCRSAGAVVPRIPRDQCIRLVSGEVRVPDARGRQRRAELIEAGASLLAQQGWSGVTHCAVAARAKANAGLVHYYFKGTTGLRQAVAEHASRASIGALLDDVLADNPHRQARPGLRPRGTVRRRAPRMAGGAVTAGGRPCRP